MCIIVLDRIDRVKQEWDKTAVSDWYMGYRKDNVVLKIIQEPESLFHPNTFSLLKNTYQIFGADIFLFRQVVITAQYLRLLPLGLMSLPVILAKNKLNLPKELQRNIIFLFSFKLKTP